MGWSMIDGKALAQAFARQGIALISQEDAERLQLWLVACGRCGTVVSASIEEKGGISSTFCGPCSEEFADGR